MVEINLNYFKGTDQNKDISNGINLEISFHIFILPFVFVLQIIAVILWNDLMWLNRQKIHVHFAHSIPPNTKHPIYTSLSETQPINRHLPTQPLV